MYLKTNTQSGFFHVARGKQNITKLCSQTSLILRPACCLERGSDLMHMKVGVSCDNNLRHALNQTSNSLLRNVQLVTVYHTLLICRGKT
jgi:hypothetical protein